MYFITVVLLFLNESNSLERYKVVNEYLPFYKKEICEEYIKDYEYAIVSSIQRALMYSNIKLNSIEQISCETPEEYKAAKNILKLK